MSKQIKADIFLLVIAAVWGSSFTLMKNVLEHIPSFAYLSLRFIIAAVILIIIFRKNLTNINRKAVLYGGVIGTMLFGGMALQVTGLYFTTASNSAFITGLNVVIVPIIAAVFLKRKLDLPSVIGAALAFTGLFFLSGGVNFKFNIGDIITLLCAVCFALQIIFIDKFARQQDPVFLGMFQIAFAGLLYTGVWFTVGDGSFVLDWHVVLTLLVTGVFGTAFAYTGQTIVQKYTSPTHTALILSAEPVFGALFAAVIPNSMGETEVLTLNAIIGCVLILSGTLICELKTGKNLNKNTS